MPQTHSLSHNRTLQLTVFSFLFALTALFHQQWDYLSGFFWYSQESIFLMKFTEIWIAISALSLLLKPTSTFRLASLVTANVCDVLLSLPVVPNHWLITFFISATLLCSYILHFRDQNNSDELFFARALPSIRLSVIIFYFFAFFWKANTGYFHPERSCATEFYRHINFWVPFSPSGPFFEKVSLHYTFILEAILPFLLLFRRTRIIGVVLGLIFHFCLALDVQKIFVNFSAVMYPLLYLFLPANITEYASRQMKWISNHLNFVRWFAFTGYLALIASTFYAITSIPVWYLFGRQSLWMIYGIFALYFCAKILIPLYFPKNRELRRNLTHTAVNPEDDETKSWKSYSLYFFSFLVTLNGLSPYLGLKNRSSWQMYSNLWIEPTGSNHFVIPHSLDLLGVMSDTVKILETNDPVLKNLINQPIDGVVGETIGGAVNTAGNTAGNTAVNAPGNPPVNSAVNTPVNTAVNTPENTSQKEKENLKSESPNQNTPQDKKIMYYYLRLYLYSNPEASLVYERNGKIYKVEKAKDDPEFSTLPPLWQQKLFWFRPLGEGEEAVCQW